MYAYTLHITYTYNYMYIICMPVYEGNDSMVKRIELEVLGIFLF